MASAHTHIEIVKKKPYIEIVKKKPYKHMFPVQNIFYLSVF